MSINVRRANSNTVEILAGDGRVLARITGERVEVQYHTAQAGIAEIDVRYISDPDVRVAADKINDIVRVLRGASIISELTPEPDDLAELEGGE